MINKDLNFEKQKLFYLQSDNPPVTNERTFSDIINIGEFLSDDNYKNIYGRVKDNDIRCFIKFDDIESLLETNYSFSLGRLNDDYDINELKERLLNISKLNKQDFYNLIINSINNNMWVVQTHLDFAYVYFGLTKEMYIKAMENKQNIRRKREEEDIAYKKEIEEKRIKREQQEAEEQEKLINEAEIKFKNKKFITNTEFELLCKKHNIKLPIKFIGWLREHCGDIKCVKKYTLQEINEIHYIYKYEVLYYRDKGNKSTKMGDYINLLAETLNIE